MEILRVARETRLCFNGTPLGEVDIRSQLKWPLWARFVLAQELRRPQVRLVHALTKGQAIKRPAPESHK